MILDDIVEERKIQLVREKEELSLEEILSTIGKEGKKKSFRLKKAFKEKGFGIIAEVKKASPSLGVIKEDFRPLEIATSYMKAGALGISVLTEEKYFMGSNSYLRDISSKVDLPILRKDFIIDEYQIYHSRYLGASAILLIVAILSKEKLAKYIKIADSLGLDALVEVHTKEELEIALEIDSKIIGINNRDLKSFKVDINNTASLVKDIPKDKIIISESGIKRIEDIKLIKDLGCNGALIGEAFMTSSDVGKKIRELS